MVSKLFFICLVFVTVASSSKLALGDLISSLPGLDTPINFKQYSGYITVNPVNGARLFYWYVESQSNPSTDPLVLWLNGGPGCSSLGGFLGELGPFYVKPNATLGINEYSWNKIANMLFLEAPAGVGFSKIDQSMNYNDENTAMDSLNFLMKFFDMYPHLKTNDFWMTGESYAGHYIPNLADKVIRHNKNASSNEKINLKGVMIGNPLTIGTVDFGATYDYIYAHELMSNSTYTAITEHCNLTFQNPPPNRHLNPEKCAQYQEKSTSEMGPINPYDIYADVCIEKKRYSRSNGRALVNLLANSKMEISGFARGLLKQKNLQAPYYPCQDNYIQSYLNNPAVQKAIHAETTKWVDCNLDINTKYSQSDVQSSLLPVYTNVLLGSGLKILIYSGDVDTVVCATGSRRWIRLLGLTLKTSWMPWIDSEQQVGGYMEVYNELTYATVRNAGHEVPSFQPARAYDMFSRFLNDKML